jgi:hypothetical protein
LEIHPPFPIAAVGTGTLIEFWGWRQKAANRGRFITEKTT